MFSEIFSTLYVNYGSWYYWTLNRINKRALKRASGWNILKFNKWQVTVICGPSVWFLKILFNQILFLILTLTCLIDCRGDGNKWRVGNSPKFSCNCRMANINERRIYPFNKDLQIYWWCTTPFWHVWHLCTRNYGMETLQVVRLAFLI